MVRKWLPVVIATVVGLLVLLGYLFPNRLMVSYRGQSVALHDLLVQWAVIVAAFALLLGLFSILRVHGGRIARMRRGWFHSLVLVVTAVASIVPGLLGPEATASRLIWRYVIGPLGAALAALIVFTLTLAAFRLLRTRFSLWAVLFLGVVIIALLGSVPLAGLGWLADVRAWIMQVPGMAGTRGLLLGVALGTVVIGLRVLLGSERPHSES